MRLSRGEVGNTGSEKENINSPQEQRSAEKPADPAGNPPSRDITLESSEDVGATDDIQPAILKSLAF